MPQRRPRRLADRSIPRPEAWSPGISLARTRAWLNRSHIRLVGFLFLLVLAEAVGAAGATWLGLIMHVLLLLWLAVGSVTAVAESESRLLTALMLAPLIRLVSLSMPLFRLPEQLWQGSVAISILAAAVIVMRQSGLRPSAAGLSSRQLWLQIPLGGIGFGLGVLGHAFVPPDRAPPALGPELFVVASGMLLLAGLTEELAFRGVILALARPIWGRAAVLFVALVYTALQVGHGAAPNLALAFAIAVFFTYLVQLGRSIVGVSLAHGVANVMLFLVLPYVALENVLWLAVAGTVAGLGAIALLLIPDTPDTLPHELLPTSVTDEIIVQSRVERLTAYASDCVVTAHLVVPEGRLSDFLNRSDSLSLYDVTVQAHEDGRTLEVATVEVGLDEIFAIEATAIDGVARKRLRTLAFRMELDLGPYHMLGYIHARPGVQPYAALTQRKRFLPLTAARIAYPIGQHFELRAVETLIVNGRLVDSIRPQDSETEWEKVLGLPTKADERGEYLSRLLRPNQSRSD